MEQSFYSTHVSLEELSYLEGGIFKRLELTLEEKLVVLQGIVDLKKLAEEQNKFVVSVDVTGERLRFFHKIFGFYAWGKKIEDLLGRNMS